MRRPPCTFPCATVPPAVLAVFAGIAGVAGVAGNAGIAGIAGVAATALRAQEDTPRGRTRYKGREIARTMHYLGAPWLVRGGREREEDCVTLLRALGVQPGDIVCDFGCGNGFYTIELAKSVGPKGKVLAVDIQKQMLGMLRVRARDAGVAPRIETIHNTVTDAKLPPNSVDLVLLVDVYHELSHPVTTLRALHASLRPGGRIALAEFREEDPKVPIKPLHKMSKQQILREWIPNGFRLVGQFDGLPWQHLMFFGRAADDPVATAARAALGRAGRFAQQLSVRGGYAGIYSLDLEQRFGEALYEPARQTEIWVQPPGTPSAGAAFLRAFRLTGERRDFAAARAAGRALAWGQRQSGGWDHRVDVAHLQPESERPVRHGTRGTFDDDITQGALTFLIELDDLVQEPWLTASIDLGIGYLLQSQFENGAWPQWYPLRGGYHDLYTFNDNAINDCIRVALLAHDRYGRKDCLAAARRGGAFILQSQGAAPQAGWAQQYSADMKPAKGRAFEPAAMCTAVTARNMRTLIDLHIRTGEARFTKPLAAAAAWLRKVRREDGTWARFHELRTDRAIYGDRDGSVHYRLDEVSAERRQGYGWHGSYGIPRVLRECEVLREGGVAGLAAWREEQAPAPADRAQAARQRARAAIAALDAEGRWVRDGRIHTADLVRNLDALCDCLAWPLR